jgi:RimJ/RimL family protein N-acetyltransferase
MIRPATASDVGSWVALAVSMEEYYPGLDPESHARIVEKCAASGEALVAEWDGAFAGGLLFSRKRRELSFLMVAPWARRHGLGRALVARMRSAFPGGETISVTTYRADDPLGAAAGPFYASQGFVPGADVVAHGHPERTMVLFLPLETERLLIRPFRDADFPAFLSMLDMPEVPGWGMQKPRARAFFEWHVENARKMDVAGGIVCLGAFEKESGVLVGAAGAGRHDDLGETEVFYSVLPEYRRRGYATEACRAVTTWALARFSLPFIIGTAGVDNIASRRVLERCGYRLVDERALDVHVTGTRHVFAYYKKEDA